MQKTFKLFLGLLAMLFFLLAIGLTAEGAINVDDVEKTITLTAETYNMDDIYADADVASDVELQNMTDGTWLLNYSIIVDGDAGLELSPSAGSTGCSWLKLNRKNDSGKENAYIKVNGNAWFNDTMVTAVNATGVNDTNTTDFRPYILIIPEDSGDTPYLWIKNSTVAYLGWDIDDKRGITYEADTIEGSRVQSNGYIHNSTISHNYIGVTFSACDNMYVTDSYFQRNYEAGIVYTTSDNIGGTRGSHNGYIGTNHTKTTGTDGQYSDTHLYYTDALYGGTTGDGIRCLNSDNLTTENVVVWDVQNVGIRITTNCDNHSWTSLTVYETTDSASDYQVLCDTVTNITFTSSNVYTPDGTANGGNWKILDSSYVNFSQCNAYGSASHSDYWFSGSDHCYVDNSTANNSLNGFYIYQGHNNSLVDCSSHNHTTGIGMILLGSDYNTITDGNVDDNKYGIKIYDYIHLAVSEIAEYNTVSGTTLSGNTDIGILLGASGGETDTSNNNVITGVSVTGATGATGIGLYDSVNNNYINNSGFNSSTGTGAEGCSMSGSGVNNNSFNNDYFCSNQYGLWAWSNADNTNNNNVFDNCYFNSNVYGIDVGRLSGISFTDSTITSNTRNGVEMRTGVSATMTTTYSYSNGANYYDIVVDNSSYLTYTGRYILTEKDTDLSNTIGDAYDDNTVSHSAGDGIDNITTRNFYAKTDSGTATIVTSTWNNPSNVMWTVNDNAGTVYHRIGGLTASTLYYLYDDGNWRTTYNAQSGAMLGGSTTGYVWWNFSGPWSTNLLRVTTTSPDSSGSGGGGSTSSRNSVTVHVISDTQSLANANVYIYSSSGAIIASGTTDSLGEYSTNLDDGSYTVDVRADGYNSVEKTISVTDDMTTTISMSETGISIWFFISIIAIIGCAIAVVAWYKYYYAY